MLPLIILLSAFGAVILFSLVRSVRIVPARTTQVVERLGKFQQALSPGFHMLFPFIDKVRYQHSLKEQAVDVPTQTCFTLDNVRVSVDGVLYFQVIDPKKASYGITNYHFATVQLAQTTMRSVIGKLVLDKTFEERNQINADIVKELDEATDPWGVRVTRYEIKNIEIPNNILNSMESQMRAEREKRARISRSIGEMESKINHSEADRQEAINHAEGEKQKRINEAEGRAAEIRSIAQATSQGIAAMADAISVEGGVDALNLQVQESYIRTMGGLAKRDTRVVLPLDLANIDETLKNIKEFVEGKNRQISKK
jgi:regulator of protease activity HflC (stomatin/prohibitin superfamily)